ncbi:hypothetical protein N2152v2_001513 [Parachlorella kessleri]
MVWGRSKKKAEKPAQPARDAEEVTAASSAQRQQPLQQQPKPCCSNKKAAKEVEEAAAPTFEEFEFGSITGGGLMLIGDCKSGNTQDIPACNWRIARSDAEAPQAKVHLIF